VLFREALAGQRRVLGPDHVDSLATLFNLGNAVDSRNKPESLALYLEALERQRRVLGENHPHTLMAMNNVADAYGGMGELEKSEALHLEVLERRRKVLGPDHMDTVFSMYSLGQVTARRGRKAEALDWLRQAVDHGLQIPDEMANDENFKSLHGDPAFEALVARARQNANK
jgi:tetratricopeptide (TPR) repeat protein